MQAFNILRLYAFDARFYNKSRFLLRVIFMHIEEDYPYMRVCQV